MIKSSFVKSTFVLLSGTIASQVVLLLCSPLLSRLYGPADFGNFANYNALASILALTANLRYEHAILIARTRINTNNVYVLTLFLTLVSSFILLLLSLLLASIAPDVDYLEKISGFLLWIPLGVLVICIYSSFTQLFIREGKFKLLSSVALLNVVFTILFQILLVHLSIENGLILGSILGFCVSILFIVYFFVRDQKHRHILYQVNLQSLLATAKAHVNFPRFSLPSDILSSVSQQFVPVVILMLFNSAVAGTYSFAMRIIRMPVIVLSTSVTAVLRKSTGGAATLTRSSLMLMHRRLVVAMALIAVVPISILIIFGKELFDLVFGSQWRQAGQLSQILGVGVFFEFIGFPLSVFFVTTGKQRHLFRIQLFNSLLLFAAILTGRLFENDLSMVSVMISASMIVSNLIIIHYSRLVCSTYRDN